MRHGDPEYPNAGLFQIMPWGPADDLPIALVLTDAGRAAAADCDRHVIAAELRSKRDQLDHTPSTATGLRVRLAAEIARLERELALGKGTDGTRSTTGAADPGHARPGAPNREASRHHPFLPGADIVGRNPSMGPGSGG